MPGNKKEKGCEKMNELAEQIEATSKITSKGQITVPAEFRKALRVKEGDQLRFILKDGVVYIEPVTHLTADELFGMFDRPEDNGHFVLDLDKSREERATAILKKYKKEDKGD